MIYLSAPYYHEDQGVIEQRMIFVKRYAARLVMQGNLVASPLLTYHGLLTPEEMRRVSTHFWMKASASVLKTCDSMVLLMLPGWEQSSGVNAELDWAEKLCIPVQKVPEMVAMI